MATNSRNASDNAYRLGTICRFALPGIDPPVLFGDRALDTITTDDIDLQENAESAQADLPQSDANSAELSSKPTVQ